MQSDKTTVIGKAAASLWRGRRLLPLFVTQFLGAFNDNLLKNALVVLITYRLAEQAGMSAGKLVTLAAGIFILPFCLLSGTAGQLADSYDRARIAQMVKLAEIVIFIFAFLGFALSHVWLLMCALFLLGIHSAFFGPVKYALLPQYLLPEELLSGNAYIGAGTFIAILLGTITAGLLVLAPQGTNIVAGLGIALAALGYFASRFLPAAPPAAQHAHVDRNIFAATWRTLQGAWEDPATRSHCLTISWFWFVGATYLAQIAVFCRDLLQGDQTVVTFLLTLFSVGIAAGSLLAKFGGRWQQWRQGAGWAAAAALAMALFGYDVVTAAKAMPVAETMRDMAGFLAAPGGYRITGDVFLLAVAGGAYVVPLYTALQRVADPRRIARTIGGLNVLNALYMVASALAALAVLAAGYGVAGVFLMVAAGNALFALRLALRLCPLPAKAKTP